MRGEWTAAELLVKGERVRFGGDEHSVDNLPSDLQHKTQNPGGYGEASFIVRRPDWLTQQAVQYAPSRLYGPGGCDRHIGRVSDVVKADGEFVRIELEGRVAELADNEYFRFLGVHNDMGDWGSPSTQRQIDLTDDWILEAPSTGQADSGLPALMLSVGPKESTVKAGLCEAMLNIDNMALGALLGSWVKSPNLDAAGDGNWHLDARLAEDDVQSGVVDNTGELFPGATPWIVNPSGDRRRAFVDLLYETAGALNETYLATLPVLSQFGRHGLPARALADGRWGLRTSDVIGHLVSTYSSLPVLPNSIEDSELDVPHIVQTSGTMTSLIEDLSLYGGGTGDLNDWGCYDHFFWRSPGWARTWRLRRDQVELDDDDGVSAKERFRGVVVTWSDGAGRSHSAGPPGSGADTETEMLVDPDPDNPAPADRFVEQPIEAPNPSLEGAILVGLARLATQKLSGRHGTATMTGYVTDTTGIEEPVAEVKACDYVLFENEDQPASLPVVTTGFEQNGETNTAEIGRTPDRLAAFLARQGAAGPN